MTDQEVLALLVKIDDGYKPTEEEKAELSNIEKINWKNIGAIPESIDTLTGLTELHVSGDFFDRSSSKVIPKSLGNLANLQHLDLSYMELSEILESIVNLTSLESLDLSYTQVSELPERIGNLTSLQSLNLRHTMLRKLPDSIGKLTNLQNLDLRHTMLRKLPESIGNLSNLHSLGLFSTQLSELPESIGNLTSLQSLNLSGTQVSELPESIGNLTSLQSLNLSGTQVSELPESIGKLTSLKSFDLSYIHLRGLPESIGKLKNLQSLDLSYTYLSELQESIGNLTSLQSLSLTSTQISIVPDSLGSLTSLQNLSMRLTHIYMLPESIGNLSKIESLDLSYTQLRELPESIENLTSLQILNLRSTQIIQLPKCVGELTYLQSLDLSSTQIRKLPESIGKLTNLQSLDLSSTQIKKLPESIGMLSKLRTIVFEELILSELPASLLYLNIEYKDRVFGKEDIGSGIYIHGLRLQKQPVSLFYQPRELIIDYYRQPKREINETKVIFLGSEGVGKTHTIKRILNDNHKIREKLKETPGISIASKEFKTKRLVYHINFWDFGGQQIMHAMHRCFLTNRTGYVIVVSTRYGDVTAQARLWLRNLRTFAEEAPVLIFVNVWNDGFYYGIDESRLRHEFDNIVSVVHCSAKDSETQEFAIVTEAIQKLAESNDSIEMSFPETWENIRQEIITEGKKHNCIDSEQYKKICNKNNVTDPSIQGWLLDWFNDLGECFTYQSGQVIVSGDRYSMILNPEWLTNAIYLIIREMGYAAEKGVVSHRIIKKLLMTSKNGTRPDLKYSEDDCDYILEVMRRHQLSYKIPAREKEFIPALLCDSSDEIKITKGTDSISYEMQYDYLPKNILHNLLVEYYVLIDENECWRNQFAVQVKDLQGMEMRAVISADYERNIIYIQIEQYAERETWESLQAVRSKILELNEKMNLNAREFIVVNSMDEDGRTEKVNVKRLLKLQERGVERYEAYEQGYDIDKLLGKAFGEVTAEKVKKIQTGEDISIDRLIELLGERSAKNIFNIKIKELLSIEDIYEYVMDACRQIQARMIFWSRPGQDVPEDVRNDEMRDLINSRGLFVRDQTHSGYGEKRKNPGEVDLMILKPSGDIQKQMTLIEAMNLKGVITKIITKHLNKLVVSYNSSGLQDLFLVSYVELERKKFSSFWNRYKKKIMELNGDGFRINNKVKPTINEELRWLKSIKMTYEYEDQTFCVYHICARVAE